MAGVFAALASRGAPLLRGLPGVSSLIGRFGGGAGTTAAGTALRGVGGAYRNLAGFGLPGVAGTAARGFTSFSLGTAALGAAKNLLGGGGGGPFEPAGFQAAGLQQFGDGQGMLQGILAAQGGMITKVWQPTDTSPIFAKLDFPGSNRRSKIIFQRRDGTIGTYTPQRMIVLSRNPRVRDLAKAAKRIDSLTSAVVKLPVQTRRSKKRMTGK